MAPRAAFAPHAVLCVLVPLAGLLIASALQEDAAEKDVTLPKDSVVAREDDVPPRGEDVPSRGKDVPSRGEDADLRKEDTTPRKEDLTLRKDDVALQQDIDADNEETPRTGRAIHRDSTHPHPMLLTGEADTEDLAYQSCRTPHGENGHCRHVRYCVLDEFRNDFDRFRDYACVIEGKFIGVCCPDSRDILDKSRDFPTRSNGTRGQFPAVGSGRRGFEPTRTRKPAPLDSSSLRTANMDSMSAVNRALVQNEGCGVARIRSRQRNAKVEGGSDTQPGEHPWMAALFRSGGQQFCGGVLLDSLHVLTAAHCVYNLDPSDLTVGLGEYDLSRPEQGVVQTFDVEDILVYERFDAEAYTDDIALLYLSRECEFTDYVWPICLPPPDINLAGQDATVIGWGTVYYGGPPSDVLMQVTIPVWSNEECQSVFDQPILDTEICAGAFAGGRDSCQGDSGGPLLLLTDDNRWCNIGIVSFGVRCGEPGKPGVYTRVSKYLNWIAQNSL